MGTTGGDQGLEDTVRTSSILVIAPNMAKQIVGFQAMMEYAANKFPIFSTDILLKSKRAIRKEKQTPAEPPKPWSVFQQPGIQPLPKMIL